MRDVLGLVFGAFAARLLYHLTYAPGWCLDSLDYTRRWLTLWNRTWEVYDGYKPPMYSVFTGIAQGIIGAVPAARLSYPSAEAAVYLQQLAGLSAVIMLYFFLRNLDAGRRTAFWGALFFGTLASVCVFEVLILSLALTAFFLLTALWLCSWALRRAVQGRGYKFPAIGSGLAFSLATLTRSEIFVFLLILILTCVTLSLVYRDRFEFVSLRPVLLRVGLGALPLVVGLMSFNGIILGQFTLTSASAYASTSTVYNLFDRVPRRDRVFGKIMTKYYKGPSRIDLVNDAWPELAAHFTEMPIKHRGPWTGNSDMMAYAGEVAHRLQRRYPLVFVSNATASFGRTFDFNQGRGIAQAPAHDPEAPDGSRILKWPAGDSLAESIRWVQAPMMLALYCLMLLFIPVALLLVTMTKSRPSLKLAFAFAMALSTVATLVAFGFAHTYFSHYGIVYFGCIVSCGVILLEALVGWWKTRNNSRALAE